MTTKNKPSLNKKAFREVWHPMIAVEQISGDPYKYRAVAQIDYYGRKEMTSAFGETAYEARRLAFNQLQDRICGRG